MTEPLKIEGLWVDFHETVMNFFLHHLIVDIFSFPDIGGVKYGATTSADLSILFDAGGIIGM